VGGRFRGCLVRRQQQQRDDGGGPVEVAVEEADRRASGCRITTPMVLRLAAGNGLVFVPWPPCAWPFLSL
jgi:hypothetical protein